jgi:hypothetical protein
VPLQIIDIRALKDFLSIHTQDMDLASVVFVKLIFESVNFFLDNSLLTRSHPLSYPYVLTVQTPVTVSVLV